MSKRKQRRRAEKERRKATMKRKGGPMDIKQVDGPKVSKGLPKTEEEARIQIRELEFLRINLPKYPNPRIIMLLEDTAERLRTVRDLAEKFRLAEEVEENVKK